MKVANMASRKHAGQKKWLSSVQIMAAYQAVRKAVTIPPTVRTLSNGVPHAPLLNLATRAPHDPHSHGHSEAGPRVDQVPRWAGGVRSSSGLVKTMTTGTYYISSFSTLFNCYSRSFYQLPTTLHSQLRSLP